MASLFNRRQAALRLARCPATRHQLPQAEHRATARIAAALIDRLLEHHAELMADADGKTTIWFAEPGVGRRPEQPDPFVQGKTDGATQELARLVRTIPGVSKAVHKRLREMPPQPGITVL